MQRRQFDGIAVTHVDDRDVGVPDLHARRGEDRGHGAELLQPYRTVEVQVAQVVDITLGIVLVGLVDGAGEKDVGRVRDGVFQIERRQPVRILHRRAPHLHAGAVAGVEGLVERHPRIVDQRQQRRELEGRPRLHTRRQGVVLHLGVGARLGTRKVGHRQQVARGDLHDQRRTPQRILRFELAAQRAVGDILHLQVERRHHVQPVLGFGVVASDHAAVETAGDALTARLAVASLEHVAQNVLHAVVALVADLPDRAARQFALRIDPFVAFAQAVGHAHIPVENGIAAQGLPLGVVDFAREKRHGRVVAQRVVELHGQELLAPHPVPPAGEAPFGARHERILAVGDAVAAGVFALHRLRIGRGRFVAEIERQQLRERIALLTERAERVEPRAAVVHFDLITEERRGQRLAVARQDVAAPCGNDLVGEDPPLQTFGVVGHLRREELHPDQTREDQRRD